MAPRFIRTEARDGKRRRVATGRLEYRSYVNGLQKSRQSAIQPADIVPSARLILFPNPWS